MENIFDSKTTQRYIDRINKMCANTQRKWGKMTVDQVLAHLNVAYSFIFEPEKQKSPSFLAKFLLKTFVKKKVTNEIPYKQNLPTSPIFIISDERNFEVEQKKIIVNIQRVQQLGKTAFEGKNHTSFGPLSASEWNNLMVKHLDHHLAQFGV